MRLFLGVMLACIGLAVFGGLAGVQPAPVRAVPRATNTPELPAPAELTVYGIPGGTCATAPAAYAILSDPPGTLSPSGITMCWPVPPAWIEARGTGGTTRWERDPPPPTPMPEPSFPYTIVLMPVSR